MTEQLISNDELVRGYNLYKKIRDTQLISNKKYRATEKGKIKTYELHKAWVATKKDDVDYKKLQNTHARARYHIRKAEKLELAEKEKNIIESLVENI